MPAPYIGGCLCGQIKFELRHEPLTFYVCHCTICQQRTGGAALPVMWVRRADLHVVEGEPIMLIFDFGRGQRRSKACPRCDTRLWAEPNDQPHLAIVRPGTLLNQSEFTPIAHIFTRSKQPWFLIPDGVPTFEGRVGDQEELLRLWRERKVDGKQTQ
ncbi:GFA family protein [Paraburkholderia sp. RL17-381-BIF-C]|uniref:GFA family protein n=1 Tax=Paraburkholderia sp. RL17-381-BIF-C TaxID=3031635 RepID=UPI0038B9F0C7